MCLKFETCFVECCFDFVRVIFWKLVPLICMQKLFICLVEVEQSPPSSIQDALSPLKKALVDERLFKHWNVHVRVHVASCFIQVTRINAPTAPYVDEQMRVSYILVFFVVVFILIMKI